MDGRMRSPPFRNRKRLAAAAAGEDPRLLLPAMLQMKSVTERSNLLSQVSKHAK